ncbi:MAG: hypothetical protein HY703_07875 [Gemmatimonadetes bacterium]|nr:hypothetical protein [Gemmatimonadota bacterium]
MEVLAWFLILWGFMAVCGRFGCGHHRTSWRWLDEPERGGLHRGRPRGHARTARPVSGSAAVQHLEPPRETPLEALQRRFVADELTVEQYEQELDKLLHRA